MGVMAMEYGMGQLHYNIFHLFSSSGKGVEKLQTHHIPTHINKYVKRAKTYRKVGGL